MTGINIDIKALETAAQDAIHQGVGIIRLTVDSDGCCIMERVDPANVLLTFTAGRPRGLSWSEIRVLQISWATHREIMDVEANYRSLRHQVETYIK